MWKSVEGQVRVRAEGRNVERLINNALCGGIRLSRIKTVRSEGASPCARVVEMTMKLSDFRKLRKAARRCGCKIHISGRKGVPFYIGGHRDRPVLLFGWIAALAALIILSRMIWFIEIDGCYKIPWSEIAGRLEQMGVRAGIALDTQSAKDIAAAILDGDDRIAWAGARVSGTKLLVSIIEAELPPDIKQDDGFRNVYAKSDGIIVSVTAYKGKPVVFAGDAVRAGDVLITGDLSSEEREVLVAAKGEVMAQVLYRFSGVAGPTVNKDVRTGQSEPRTVVGLFNYIFSRQSYEKHETEEAGEAVMQGFFLPLFFKEEIRYEMKETAITPSETELAAIAEASAGRLMEESLAPDVRIISKKSEAASLEDGSVSFTISVTVVENIAEY